MLDLTTVTGLLGWYAVINIGLLIFSTVVLVVFNPQIKALHLLYEFRAIDSADLNTLYFNFLGNYKIAILVLNLVPYCALKILS